MPESIETTRKFFGYQSPFVVLVAMVLLVSTAWAQTPSGNTGRALDANPQAGSGGLNVREGQVDYRLRNDLVTGNVPDGRSFRGVPGFHAPGEFLGDLPSDDLFKFRRDSFSSAPQLINTVPRSPALGGGVSVYRSFSGLPAAPRGFGASTLYLVGRDGSTMLFDTGRLGVYPLLGQLQSGGTGVVLSLQPNVFLEEDTPKAFRSDLGAQALRDGQRQRLREGALHEIQDRRLQPPVEEEDPDFGLGSTVEVVGALLPLLPTDLTRWTNPTPSDEIPTTLIIGRRLQTILGSERAYRPDTLTEQRLEGIQTALTNPHAPWVAEPGGSAYQQIMAAIRGTESESDSSGSEEEDEWMPELNEPTELQLEKAEQARDESLRLLDRLRGRSEAESEDAEQEEARNPIGVTPGTANAARYPHSVSKRLDDLLKRLKYDLPRFPTLTGDRQAKINGLMQRGEAELAAGKFLTAEGVYRQVLLESPDHPMARVGLIHAQLGAGMIRSAALNLRRLFERRPELIAARYDKNLLPNESRLRWVQGELDRIIAMGNAPSDAGLMMAYLGHQVASRHLVKYGLLIAESSAPTDPLVPVLKHIWLEEAKQQTQSPASAPGQAAPEPLPPVSRRGK